MDPPTPHPAVNSALDLLHIDQSNAKPSVFVNIMRRAGESHIELVHAHSIDRFGLLRKRPPVMPQERDCEFKFICKLSL